MNKKKLTCPVCGSTKLKRFEQDASGQLTLGSQFNFREVYYKCNSCHEETDLTGETDTNYMRAKKDAEAILVNEIITCLSTLGISMVSFERVMELPIRTLTRWKTGDFSAAALALLRIIKTYPWIVKVAGYNFDTTVAREIMMKEAELSQGIIVNLDHINGKSASNITLDQPYNIGT